MALVYLVGRVKEKVLGGAELRLGRLVNWESGRSFITAFNHGTNLRVPPEAGRPLEVVERIIAGEPDGDKEDAREGSRSGRRA